ncbi:MAG: hypothetical protein HYT79_07730 [Elusimicrobia bacterium]|nr:hypothetical protein [Elusimicrobiota bacterium]
MDLALDLLEWAKDKKDLAEIYYENKSSNPPVLVHMVFEPGAHAPSSGAQALGYVRAPTIGTLTLAADKTRPGVNVKKGDPLGHVEGAAEKMALVAPFDGKVLKTLAADGRNVGYGDPIALIEIIRS